MLREPVFLENSPHEPAPEMDMNRVLMAAQCATTAHTRADAQSTTMFDLPTELTSQITAQVDYHDATSFRLTCRSARDLIPFKKDLAVKRATLRACLLAAERAESQRRVEAWQNAHNWAAFFPRSAGPGGPNEGVTNLHNNRITPVEHLNCYACLRTLPRGKFHVGQTKGLRSLGHKEHAKRFCVDCGWGKGIWTRGSAAGRGAQCVVVCRFCGGLNREADPLCRRERVCSMTCWSQGLSFPGGDVAALEQKAEVEDEQQQPQQDWKVPVSSSPSGTGTLSRRAKCMRCWANDHTETLTSSERSGLCMACQAGLGLAEITPDEVERDVV
ncbi:hypothetical protein A1O7_03198 [Cladophialophora yegresii CBS 114405]|uniref:F-box domain-containing protein n=1 Tax=Cladophialophora yegresii CBS 114405 TaxID=1182544 RepID=W9WWU2_9EURO|nr:uncharacterized protein A1O7_03198 [Cladophialophora yegresii CBS 114405]EXJ62759.1 hypothetical protein A1O7_03198 [Cladophialophora yegresii CBS 114405]